MKSETRSAARGVRQFFRRPEARHAGLGHRTLRDLPRTAASISKRGRPGRRTPARITSVPAPACSDELQLTAWPLRRLVHPKLRDPEVLIRVDGPEDGEVLRVEQ